MDASALASSAEALRSAIKTLESRSNSLESWLYFWVLLVVVGVAVEVILVVLEYRERLEDFHRGTIHSPEKPKKLKFGVETLAAILVVSGVAGELVIDIRAGKIQTDLRNKNANLIQLLEGAAGAALNHAVEVEQSNKQLGLDLEVEHQKTARLQKEAEHERLTRVKAQLQFMRYFNRLAMASGWRINAFDAERFKALLKGKPRAFVDVRYVGDGDDEAKAFASAIATTLGKNGVGWDVSGPVELTREAVGPVFDVAKNAGFGGLGMVAARPFSDPNKNTAWNALTDALLYSMLAPGGLSLNGAESPYDLKEHIILVIGHQRIFTGPIPPEVFAK
jgi:hypothetical protein